MMYNYYMSDVLVRLERDHLDWPFFLLSEWLSLHWYIVNYLEKHRVES